MDRGRERADWQDLVVEPPVSGPHDVPATWNPKPAGRPIDPRGSSSASNPRPNPALSRSNRKCRPSRDRDRSDSRLRRGRGARFRHLRPGFGSNPALTDMRALALLSGPMPTISPNWPFRSTTRRSRQTATRRARRRSRGRSRGHISGAAGRGGFRSGRSRGPDRDIHVPAAGQGPRRRRAGLPRGHGGACSRSTIAPARASPAS